MGGIPKGCPPFLVAEMKNVVVFLLALLLLLPSGGRGKFQVCGPIKNNIGSYSYVKDSSVLFQFRYVNVGDSLLTVTQVVPSCPCMEVSWTHEPVAPGDTGSIQVLYFADRPGHFRKSLTVINNGFPEWSYLYVEGTALEASDD